MTTLIDLVEACEDYVNLHDSELYSPQKAIQLKEVIFRMAMELSLSEEVWEALKELNRLHRRQA